jgi:NAD+ synthase (glutamine-hydrolysing)
MFLEEYGFVRAAAASLAVRAAEPEFNGREVVRAMREAEGEGARLLALPELCLTGYTCGDLFHQDALLGAAEAALALVLAETRGLSVAAALGLPVAAENRLFNCAAVIQRGRVLGLVPMSFLPGYGEFYEERWFSPAPSLRAASVRLAGEDGAGRHDVSQLQRLLDSFVIDRPDISSVRGTCALTKGVPGNLHLKQPYCGDSYRA